MSASEGWMSAEFESFRKYLIESTKPHLTLARQYYSQLDAFASGIHPHLLDRPGKQNESTSRSLRHEWYVEPGTKPPRRGTVLTDDLLLN